MMKKVYVKHYDTENPTKFLDAALTLGFVVEIRKTKESMNINRIAQLPVQYRVSLFKLEPANKAGGTVTTK